MAAPDRPDPPRRAWIRWLPAEPPRTPCGACCGGPTAGCPRTSTLRRSSCCSSASGCFRSSIRIRLALDQPGSAQARVETYTALANYRELVGDDSSGNAVKNTFLLMVMCSVPQLVLALVLAHILNARLRFRTTLSHGRAPAQRHAIVAVALVCSLRSSAATSASSTGARTRRDRPDHLAERGLDLQVRDRGHGGLAMDRLQRPHHLGAMQAIPKELFEAAALDRAGTWRSCGTSRSPRSGPRSRSPRWSR